MIDLKQKELYAWQQRNFPTTDLEKLSKDELIRIIVILQVTVGIVEEVGEVSHHILKGTQGIRDRVNGIDGAEVADGICDGLIYGLQLLSLLQIDAEGEFGKVIKEILVRDWLNYPVTGKPELSDDFSLVPK